jgi:hypothetical protein
MAFGSALRLRMRNAGAQSIRFCKYKCSKSGRPAIILRHRARMAEDKREAKLLALQKRAAEIGDAANQADLIEEILKLLEQIQRDENGAGSSS